jgi:C1A family cysteine protease
MRALRYILPALLILAGVTMLLRMRHSKKMSLEVPLRNKTKPILNNKTDPIKANYTQWKLKFGRKYPSGSIDNYRF